MSENHKGESERIEIFNNMRFKHAHSVHSIRRVNYWKKFYEPTHFVRVEKEWTNWYHIYIRRK